MRDSKLAQKFHGILDSNGANVIRDRTKNILRGAENELIFQWDTRSILAIGSPKSPVYFTREYEIENGQDSL